jgi:hypothetical protein
MFVNKHTWELARQIAARPPKDYSHITNVKCFWLESLGMSRLHLRRYRSSDKDKCIGTGWYHNANGVTIGDFKDILSEEGYIKGHADEPNIPHDDPRWPTKCDACSYEFTEEDQWQVFGDSLYRRSDTGEIYTRNDAPVGAMFDAWWMGRKGPDGRSLIIKLPGDHDWTVDGNCSNCNMKEKHHYCWPRRGEVPNITVDKSFGNTCTVGRGSVIYDGWRGTVRNGYLVHD